MANAYIRLSERERRYAVAHGDLSLTQIATFRFFRLVLGHGQNLVNAHLFFGVSAVFLLSPVITPSQDLIAAFIAALLVGLSVRNRYYSCGLPFIAANIGLSLIGEIIRKA